MIETKCRERNYDLLRVICCIFVILLHVSAYYKSAILDDSYFGIQISSNVFLILLYNTIPRFAVPCFIMMSGAFSISASTNVDFAPYYKKVFKQIGIHTLIFSAGYCIIQILHFAWTAVQSHDGYSLIIYPIKLWMRGEPYYHMWYLYMMISLYFLVPIINRCIANVKHETFNRIAIVIAIFTLISGYTSTHKYSWDIGYAIDHLGYFLLGYVLHEKLNKKKNNVVGINLIGGGYCM